MASKSKEKDQAMAAYMKAHPSSFPDSVMRPWHGAGAADRDRARTMGNVSNNSSSWVNGMLGGVIFAKLGYSKHGIPADFLN